MYVAYVIMYIKVLFQSVWICNNIIMLVTDNMSASPLLQLIFI